MALLTAATGGSAASYRAVSAAVVRLPVSVEPDAYMHAAGNNGPSSSILVPAGCEVDGSTVSARGSYQGGFAPEVYRRYGDIIDLYVFTGPAIGFPRGYQEAILSSEHSPRLGTGTWTVTAPIDSSLGRPRRCVVAAQPTHDWQGAPNAY